MEETTLEALTTQETMHPYLYIYLSATSKTMFEDMTALHDREKSSRR